MIIGITGGIGSGKTIASKLFEKYSVPVINADVIAKSIAENNLRVKQKIVSRFGAESYNFNNYNRKYIAKIVFQNKKALKDLNRIIHPPTFVKIKNKINLLEPQKNKYCIIEAALILKTQLQKIIDYIIMVEADKTIKIKRLIDAGNLSSEQIKSRMKSQMSDKEMKKYADFILLNNSSKADLKKSVSVLHKIFLSLK